MCDDHQGTERGVYLKARPECKYSVCSVQRKYILNQGFCQEINFCQAIHRSAPQVVSGGASAGRRQPALNFTIDLHLCRSYIMFSFQLQNPSVIIRSSSRKEFVCPGYENT
jgi:hypothetical protein